MCLCASAPLAMNSQAGAYVLNTSCHEQPGLCPCALAPLAMNSQVMCLEHHALAVRHSIARL